MRMPNQTRFTWLIYLLWAIFVNAINAWILVPLAEDYAFLGIVAIFAMSLLWLWSIPKDKRRKWVMFTLFSLMLGSGLSSVAFYPLFTRTLLSLVICVGLFLVTWIAARVRVIPLILSSLGLVAANAILPVSEWPFLTHFSVAHYGLMNLQPNDLPALPMLKVAGPSGDALVTLRNVSEKTLQLQQAAESATGSPDALGNVLQNYMHKYSFIELAQVNGKLVEQPATPQVLALVDPHQLVSSFFPFTRAYWMNENNQLVQFMGPSLSPQDLTQMTINGANSPANVMALATHMEAQEVSDWSNILKRFGAVPKPSALHIQAGELEGNYAGQAVHLKVQGTAIVGTGSFTAAGAHEMLLQGANLLQVVSFDGAKPLVVTTYRGNAQAPLPNDIVIGQVDASGRNVLFVNSQPAIILQPEPAGTWRTLYTAPNASLRFECSVLFQGEHTPEIITDDPSYLRNIPTRYFSSYTYQNGQLERNWRVYRTDVVNVQSMQFVKGGSPYIVASIYASGKFIVLKRHYLPVVPAAGAALGAVLLAGWFMRIRERGGKINA